MKCDYMFGIYNTAPRRWGASGVSGRAGVCVCAFAAPFSYCGSPGCLGLQLGGLPMCSAKALCRCTRV